MTEFGARLKAARKQRKYTQKELARRLGVKQSTVSNYESGARLPSAPALVEIANELSVSVDHLLGRTEPIQNDNGPEAFSEASGFPYLSDSAGAAGWEKEGAAANDAGADPEALRDAFFAYVQQGRLADASALIRTSSLAGAGLLTLYETVFRPTLQRIGDLWEAGTISVADEHMASELIDRLLVLLRQDRQKTPIPSRPFTAVLMLPGAERHEFPLKITADIFRNRGWKTYYLGTSVPVASLLDFFRKKRVDVLALSVTVGSSFNGCEALVQAVKSIGPTAPLILVGGNAIENETQALQDLGADLYFPSVRALQEGLEALEQRLQRRAAGTSGAASSR